MQFFNTITLTTATLIGLAAAAASSDVSSLVSQIPSCADTCLDQGAAAASCGTTDYACQCEHQDTIASNATTCLVSSCSVSDISSTCFFSPPSFFFLSLSLSQPVSPPHLPPHPLDSPIISFYREEEEEKETVD